MLFAVLPESQHLALIGEAREMAMDFISQLEWRFFYLQDYPHRFVQWVHPRIPRPDRECIIDDFYELSECCLDHEFGLRVRKLFPTAAALRASADFEAGLKLFARYKHFIPCCSKSITSVLDL